MEYVSCLKCKQVYFSLLYAERWSKTGLRTGGGGGEVGRGVGRQSYSKSRIQAAFRCVRSAPAFRLMRCSKSMKHERDYGGE